MAFGISAATAMAVGAGAMAVGSMYSANKASSASKNATRAAGEMARDQLALDTETLDFYKKQYADSKPYQEAQAKAAAEVSNAQLGSMRQNDAIAKDYYDYQTGTFRPMEKQLVADAQNYDTEARRDEKANQALADVQQQSDMAAGQLSRSLSASGVDPSNGRSLAMRGQLSMQTALGKAAAAGKAREQVEIQGYARKVDAANLGRNLPSNQATSAGLAITAGNSAVTNATAPVNTINGMTQTMGQGYSNAINGMSGAHNMINAANNNQANMWGNAAGSLFGAAGSMAGTLMAGKKK